MDGLAGGDRRRADRARIHRTPRGAPDRPARNVSGLMRAAGNRDGGLPFTVALRQRRICREGVLTPLDLVHIEAACTAATATPR